MRIILVGLVDRLGLYMAMLSVVSIYIRGTQYCTDKDLALRTGREDFTAICRKLSDVFLSLLPESGVPWW
jgi:hypothetical protein